MSDLAAWPVLCRVSFLREAWEQLGGEAGDRPIAIYGAGRHTAALLPIVAALPNAPRIEAILDDHAGAGAPRELHGIGVRKPADVSPDAVAMVVVSSDSMEQVLTERATAWARGRTPVRRLYGDEFAELRREHRKRSGGVWGTTTVPTNDHLPMAPNQPVLRLAPAPSRAPESALPLPPPELRAGYHTIDDNEYLRSGARDAAAFRALISEHAPGVAVKRVLDWGCSSGRIIRHWTDLALAGGEVWGCDICATAINWAAENLSPPCRFFTCTTRPTLPLPDASLDLVYAKSVFTHIREFVDAWLMELRRVLRPGGLLIATILDEHCWAYFSTLPDHSIRKRCPDLDFARPLTDDFVCSGGAFDPVTFWHTRGVRRRWSFAFDVVTIQRALVPYQTGVLLRRPE